MGNRLLGQGALNSEIQHLAEAPPGERNGALNDSAFRMGQLVTRGDVDETEARRRLLDTTRPWNGIPGRDGKDPWTEAEALRTIESGITGGKAKPRGNPPPRVATVSRHSTGRLVPPSLDDLVDGAMSTPNGDGPPPRVRLTPASQIRTRRVRWLWDGRLAIGVLALLAGREGLGKSSFAYLLAALVTRGQLPGQHHGQPRAVLVCATEDSWEHTIVPRLVAVGADLALVYRVEVIAADDIHIGLVLPHDLAEVDRAARGTGAVLLVLDPLMSRLSPGLDPHKDGEVRRALEPMTAMADRAGLTVLGIIHLNKTGSVDILDRVMGSKAFAAVARAVCAVVPDPDDENGRRRLFGVPKNNLGRVDLPSITFTIEGAPVRTDDGATSNVGRVVLGDETGTTITEAMERNAQDPEVRTQTGDAKAWLADYLTEHTHTDSRDIKREAKSAGFSESTLHRARKALKVDVIAVSTTPYRTVWALPTRPVSELSNRASRARGDEIDEIVDIDAGQSDLDDQRDTVNYSIYVNYANPPARAHASGDENEEDQP